MQRLSFLHPDFFPTNTEPFKKNYEWPGMSYMFEVRTGAVSCLAIGHSGNALEDADAE